VYSCVDGCRRDAQPAEGIKYMSAFDNGGALLEEYISLQMMIGTAFGTNPFPREKSQQEMLAQWLEVQMDASTGC
jgi:hypothetical protein